MPEKDKQPKKSDADDKDKKRREDKAQADEERRREIEAICRELEYEGMG